MDYYLLAGIGLSVASFALLGLMLFINTSNLTIWHGVALGAISLFAASMVNTYTQLYDWVVLGMTGGSTYATIFVLGMIAFVCVMIYNIIATKGKTAIR
jgi:hypothetical protein